MKYIVDIKGEIEGDYEIIGKYEERPMGERKPGKWIDDCECSSCHWIHEDDEGHALLTRYNFCPNCGMPMENGEKDEQF